MGDAEPGHVEVVACSKCGDVKPRTPEFFREAKECVGGLARVCKECIRRRQLERWRSDPEWRARYKARNRRAAQKRRADPERQARWLAHVRAYKSQPHVKGRIVELQRAPHARAVRKASCDRWRKANAQRVSVVRAQRMRERRMEDPKTVWLINAVIRMRGRAKRKGLEFDLTAADLLPVPDYCPIFGVPLDYGYKARRGHTAKSPSVDRIDPRKGYVRGNVWVISQRANIIKNDALLSELERIAAVLRARGVAE